MKFAPFNLPYDAPDEMKNQWVANIRDGVPSFVCMSVGAPPEVTRQQLLLMIFGSFQTLFLILFVLIEGRYRVFSRVMLPAVVQLVNFSYIVQPIPPSLPGAHAVGAKADASANYYKGLIDSLLK